MSSNSATEQRQNKAGKRHNTVTAVRGHAGYVLERKPRPASRQGDGRGKYFPIWYVTLRKPGEPRWNTSSTNWIVNGAEICPACMVSDEGPLARENCRCQKPLRKAIEAELAEAVKALSVTLAEGRVEQYRALHQRAGAGTATVQDVIDAVEGVRGEGELWKVKPGPEIWSAKTWRAYKPSLVRLARAVSAVDPYGAPLSMVLTRAAVEKIQCEVQGVATVAELNLKDRLDCNGGANTLLRNVKALFSNEAVMRLFQGLDLPDLTEFHRLPALPMPATGFVPWEPSVWERFVGASEALRESNPDLWLVNAFLRRTGLRDEELLDARRSWIEETKSGPVLVIKDRGAEFSLLKQGKGRRIGLDAELFGLVKDLQPDEYLVARDRSAHGRYQLIYRDHCAHVGQFIPDRQKRNHELRMMAGSLVYERDGLQAAADFLGHRSLNTTRDYYAAQLTATAPLSGAMVDRAEDKPRDMVDTITPPVKPAMMGLMDASWMCVSCRGYNRTVPIPTELGLGSCRVMRCQNCGGSQTFVVSLPPVVRRVKRVVKRSFGPDAAERITRAARKFGVLLGSNDPHSARELKAKLATEKGPFALGLEEMP